MATCTALMCWAQCSMQWDLAIDKAKPLTSAAKWQGNDQTDLQCQAPRHCHHHIHWATCLAWLRIWTSFWKSKGFTGMDMWNAPIVQSRQPLTYRLMESVGLGGPRWHGSSWQRGIAERLWAINPHDRHTWRSGPSCSKLTMSLVNDLLKFTWSDMQIYWNFLLKKCE